MSVELELYCNQCDSDKVEHLNIESKVNEPHFICECGEYGGFDKFSYIVLEKI